MFSGIIQSQGKIKKLSRKEKSLVVEIYSSLKGYKLGSSICCSGICLTVASKNKNTFKADISYETINKTNAKYWKVGKKINLEKSLKVAMRSLVILFLVTLIPLVLLKNYIKLGVVGFYLLGSQKILKNLSSKKVLFL